jgi:hypothetical protein
LNAIPYFFFPFHSVIVFTVFCLLLSFFFPIEARWGIFINLVLGALLHFLMDLLQVHRYESTYLLFPFSWRSFQLGWIGPESSLYALPFLTAFATLVLLSDYCKHKKSKRTL